MRKISGGVAPCPWRRSWSKRNARKYHRSLLAAGGWLDTARGPVIQSSRLRGRSPLNGKALAVRENAEAPFYPGQTAFPSAGGRSGHRPALPPCAASLRSSPRLCIRPDPARDFPRLLREPRCHARLPDALRFQHPDPDDLTGRGIPAAQRTGVRSPGSGAGLSHPASAPARHPDHSGRSLTMVRLRRPGPRERLSITALALPQSLTGGTVWPSRGGS